MDLRPGNAQWPGDCAGRADAFGFSAFDDTALRAHGGVLMVLADGPGDAGRAAVLALLGAYATKSVAEDVPAALHRAIAGADQAVRALPPTPTNPAPAVPDPDHQHAVTPDPDATGTALLAVVIHEGRLHWVGSGNCRLYLWQAAAGMFARCTEDHTSAAADPSGPLLRSALGLPQPPLIDDPAGRPLPLCPGDRVLACSDGVYRLIGDRELAALLDQDAQAAAAALIAAVRERAGPDADAATALVLAVGDLPAAGAAPGDGATPPPTAVSGEEQRRPGWLARGWGRLRQRLGERLTGSR